LVKLVLYQCLFFCLRPVFDLEHPFQCEVKIGESRKINQLYRPSSERIAFGKKSRLHLNSEFKIKTTFNFYAGWWAKWIMKDIQNNILQIEKKRAELP
jgi:hypothetical protein